MIHVDEAGSGPALLLLHGAAPGATGKANFGQNLDGFSRTFRTLIADLPGHGASDSLPADGGPQYRRLAAAFDADLEARGIEKVHVVGMATGGAVAVALAALFPERVGKVVLVGPPGSRAHLSPAPSEGIKAIQAYNRGSGPSREKMRSYLELTVHDPTLITEEILDERYNESVRRLGLDGQQSIGATAPGRENVLAYLPKVAAETLVVWGRGNRLQGVEGAFQFLSGLPRAEAHIYDDAGLWVPFEKKDHFEHLVTGFLTRP